MTVWAIADLHLAFSVPEKKMDVFGPEWENYPDKIAERWKACVAPEDLVLIAGDICWAKKGAQALTDLQWIENLPGTKVIIRGNHDYWWGSITQVRTLLPPSIHAIQNDAFQWGPYSIGGARLWDTPEFHFSPWIAFKGTPPRPPTPQEQKESEKTFEREINRLELSLQQLNPHAEKRIVMTHYPPLGADLKSSRVSNLLEQYRVDICVFGHLHSLKKGSTLFGEARGVHYYLTSADYLDFTPLKIF